MKKSALLIVGILFLGAFTAMAQNPVVFKYKLDQSYSVHNYKQPHKVAIAKKYNLDNLNTFTYNNPLPLPVFQVNKWSYKSQNFGNKVKTSESGAAVPTTKVKKSRNALESPANYKSQFGK
jgi:hypothetical protein